MVTWALSYIIILLLPIIISIIMYVKVDDLVKNEINRANDFYLSQVQQYMDSVADDIKLLSIQVAYNGRIQELIPTSGPLDDNQYYRLYEGVKELNNYKMTNSYTNNFFVYLKNSQLILSDKGSLENKNYYDVYTGMGSKSYDKWIEAIKGDYKGGRFISIPKDDARNENKIYYIITLPWLRQTDISANFITAIDENQFIKISDNVESANKGQLIIINEDNDIVAGEIDKNKLPEWLSYKKLDKSRDVVVGDYNGEKVVVSYVSSQVEKCKYIHIMPESVFWERLEYARKIIYISVIMCFVLGGVMTYILLKKNYAPMGSLMSELRDMPQQNGDNDSNEYQFIKKTIARAVSEKEESNKRILSQNSILKYRFIERLLKGNFGDIIVNDSLATYNINFDSNYFSAMLFYIEDFSEVFLEQTNYNSLEAFKMAQFVITNVLQELAQDKFKLFVTETDGMLAALVNLKGQNIEEGTKQVVEVAEELQCFIKNYYRINFTASISTVHEDIHGIAEAYNETLEAMEYKIVMGVEGVIFYNDTKVKINKEYYYPIEKEQQLINCIKTGDFENAGLVIEDVYKKNFEEKELSPQNAKCLFFNLISTVLKTINDLNAISAEEFSEELNRIQDLINYKNVNRAKKELKEVLKVFCEKIQVHKKSKNNCIKDKVDQYIINNYKDENLSISAIADHFDMHPSYISKLYKAQSGDGILDCINKVRIEKSKQIMKEQKMNLEDVAKATGYSNVRTFTRAFMKIEGITPGKYKEANIIM